MTDTEKKTDRAVLYRMPFHMTWMATSKATVLSTCTTTWCVLSFEPDRATRSATWSATLDAIEGVIK